MAGFFFFVSNFSLRPSCYDCPAKSGKSGADITIGDFWGIENIYPDFDDDKGISLIFINKEGVNISAKCDLISALYQDAIAGNSCICQSVAIPRNRGYFQFLLRKDGCRASLEKVNSPHVFYKLSRLFHRALCKKSKGKLSRKFIRP